MINFDSEIKSIQPINIKDMELNQYRIKDNIRKSLVLYNKAIAEIRRNNLDLAIKDLKKALHHNKGFVEGVKLLGLCYVNNKEHKKAEKTFKKLMKYEIYSELAKEYMKSLSTEKSTAKTLEAIRRVNGANNSKKSASVKNRRRNSIIGISILTILMISFSILYWVQPKFKLAPKEVEITSKTVDTEEKTDKTLEANKILYEKNIILSKNYENIQKELDNTKLELDSYKSKYDTLAMLSNVEEVLKNGDYEKAASTLLSIRSMKLDDETKLKYDKMFTYIKTNALWTIYNQGSKLYKEGKYHEALPKLKLAFEIGPSLEIMPWITYQIGVCYKETNDYTNALVYFEKVKNDYPKSEYANSSKRIISEIRN